MYSLHTVLVYFRGRERVARNLWCCPIQHCPLSERRGGIRCDGVLTCSIHSRLAQRVKIFPSYLQVTGSSWYIQLTESLGVQPLPLSSPTHKRYCLTPCPEQDRAAQCLKLKDARGNMSWVTLSWPQKTCRTEEWPLMPCGWVLAAGCSPWHEWRHSATGAKQQEKHGCICVRREDEV